MAAGSTDGAISISDTRSQSKLASLKGHTENVRSDLRNGTLVRTFTSSSCLCSCSEMCSYVMKVPCQDFFLGQNVAELLVSLSFATDGVCYLQQPVIGQLKQ